MLRKDFIVDAYQVFEARAMGADAILLIAAILDDAQLPISRPRRTRSAWRCWSRCTIASELDRALRLATPLIGINNRNLRTFEVSLETTLALLPARSGASGCSSPRAASSRRPTSSACVRAGVHAFLVGEAFMRAADPGAALSSLVA